MAPYKASRPNGFQVVFYQRFWHEVKDSICSFVKDFMRIGVLPEGENDTLIALIPKVQHPERLSQL